METKIEQESSYNEDECFEKHKFAKPVATYIAISPITNILMLVKSTPRCQL